MNVGELKEHLKEFDDSTPVLVASDPEGNGFRPLVDIEEAMIEPNGDKHGYVEDVYAVPDEDGDEEYEGYEERVVLWP